MEEAKILANCGAVCIATMRFGISKAGLAVLLLPMLNGCFLTTAIWKEANANKIDEFQRQDSSKEHPDNSFFVCARAGFIGPAR